MAGLNLHPPHQLNQREALKLPQTQEVLHIGQEVEPVFPGSPEFLRNNVVQTFPHKQIHPVSGEVRLQQRLHILRVRSPRALPLQEQGVRALPVLA